MLILITGGCKNGKSSFAQRLVCQLAEKSGKNPVYFATMIPHDNEDEERIKKHQEERAGLEFDTIETGSSFSQAVESLESGRAVLFDSLTALLANELFEDREDFSPEKIQSEAQNITSQIKENLKKLMQKSSSVVFVSDEIFCDGKYDEITEIYKKSLAEIEQFVSENCDEVNEMLSNHKIKNSNGSDTKSLSDKFPCLIIGGSYQGKTAFAKERFLISDSEICVCTQKKAPDFSKKCLSHYENYVAFCLKNKIEPKTDFSAQDNPKIIICDDIFCGVVPIDTFQRKLREKTGLALQKIAKSAEVYRVFCGKAQKI